MTTKGRTGAEHIAMTYGVTTSLTTIPELSSYIKIAISSSFA
jgi:hypothetical protein